MPGCVPKSAARAGVCLLTLAVAVSCGGSKGPGSGEAAATPATPIPGQTAPGAAPSAKTPTPGAASFVPTPGGAPAIKAPNAALPDRVVATVNGVPLHGSKLEEIVQANKMNLQARGTALTADEEKMLRASALKALVGEELLFQAAEKAGLEPAQKDVETEIQHVKTQLGSEENYKKFLQQVGVTDDQVRKDAARRLEVQNYVKGVTKGASVQEAEARKFYDANKERFQAGEQTRAQIIVVKTSPSDPEGKKADARRRAEEAHRRAEAGEDFATLAKEFSQVPSAKQGGDLGFFPRGVMFPKLDELAFSLAPGKVSPIFDTPTGLNVLKVLERKQARTLSFDEVKPSLMLDMGRAKESQILEGKLDELMAAADVKVVDPEFSAFTAAKPGAAPKTAATPSRPRNP